MGSRDHQASSGIHRRSFPKLHRFHRTSHWSHPWRSRSLVLAWYVWMMLYVLEDICSCAHPLRLFPEYFWYHPWTHGWCLHLHLVHVHAHLCRLHTHLSAPSGISLSHCSRRVLFQTLDGCRSMVGLFCWSTVEYVVDTMAWNDHLLHQLCCRIRL